MGALLLPREQAEIAIRALSTVALCDGALEGHEQSFLDAASHALSVDPRVERRPVTPAEVASVFTDAVSRTRLVQALEVMSLLDGSVSRAETECVAEFAAALGVDEPRLHNLRQIVAGHHRLLQLDLLRRSPMSGWGQEVFRKRGLLAALSYLGAPYGLSHDIDIAWRYKQLGLLPQGSFGRVYWAHMTQRRFPFPGEDKGFPEEIVRHDLCHVLSGYDTDVPGEVENAAFISGFLREDPFSYLFMVVVHTHLDIAVFPSDPSQAKFGADPARAIAALQRGMKVKRDLYDLSWDFWADLPRPIAEVREELGISPPVRPDPA